MENIARKFGLQINQEKTKYMTVERKSSLKKNKIGHLEIKNYKFERVENFKYLGVILSEDNKNQIDLQERIKNANKTYLMLRKLFKNKNMSKKLKLILKNTTIDKTLTHASETWMLTKRDRKQLNIFERKCIEEFWVQYTTMKKKTGGYYTIKKFIQVLKTYYNRDSKVN